MSVFMYSIQIMMYGKFTINYKWNQTISKIVLLYHSLNNWIVQELVSWHFKHTFILAEFKQASGFLFFFVLFFVVFFVLSNAFLYCFFCLFFFSLECVCVGGTFRKLLDCVPIVIYSCLDRSTVWLFNRSTVQPFKTLQFGHSRPYSLLFKTLQFGHSKPYSLAIQNLTVLTYTNSLCNI